MLISAAGIAEEVLHNPWASYGVLGLVCTLFATWLTVIGKWVINKFTEVLTETRGALERNTAAMDSWKRHSEEQGIVFKQFSESSEQCRNVMTQIAAKLVNPEG